MGHIFISYSHKEKEYAHKLADTLQAEGFDVWIDDRIDYGTRWPLVIEAAIDACESFILVASGNSHQSKWVQHELSRADRLNKDIFPLLLEGNPWISFEAIQYFDVRDGKLPNQKFYDSLRKVEKRRFAYFRELVTHLWPVYRSETYGFSVRYPEKGELVFIKDSFVQIDLPKIQGTDIAHRSLSISCSNDGSLANQEIQQMPWIHKSSYVDVLGLTFLRESGDDAGMSKYHELISFSTLLQSKVVRLSFHLATFAPEVFGLGPGVVVQIDRTATKEILMGVVSSFTWSD